MVCSGLCPSTRPSPPHTALTPTPPPPPPPKPPPPPGLLLASIRDPNPVIFLEAKMLYRTGERGWGGGGGRRRPFVAAAQGAVRRALAA